jgi:hypothetical protein
MSTSTRLTSREVTQDAPTPVRGGVSPIAIFAALLCAVVVCYANTLNCYFTGDDFTDLKFVRSVQNLGLGILVPIFTTPLHELQSFLNCYRPLPILAFVGEFLVGGGSPYAFHVTNVVCHTLSAWFVFFIGERLTKSKLIGFFAAMLFAVYPVSAEAVNLPNNIVTHMATMPFLGALSAFLAWFEGGRRVWLVASIIAFAFALLSKETALVLPAVLTAFVWFRERKLAALGWTAPYWITLLAYIGLRSAIIGPGIGGYRGPAADALNQTFFERFVSAWPATLFFPLNPEVFQNEIGIYALLGTLYAVVAVLAVRSRLKHGAQDRSQNFLFTWLAIGFLSVAPVWLLDATLWGGRHFYLISAPFFLALLALSYSESHRRVWCLAWSCVVVCFATMTIHNNVAYVEAANQSLALEKCIAVERHHMNEKQHLVLVNAPYLHKGYFLFPFAYMFKDMCSDRVDLRDVEVVAPWSAGSYNLFNADRLQALAESPLHRVVVWDAENECLWKFNGNFGSGDLDEKASPTYCETNSDKRLSAQGFYFPAGLAHQTSFIECTITCTKLQPASGAPPMVTLAWQTPEDMQMTGERKIELPVIADGQPHVYRFPVGSSMRWLLPKLTGNLELRVPNSGFDCKLGDMQLLGWRHRAPSIRVTDGEAYSGKLEISNGDALGSDGILQLPQRKGFVEYDAALMKDVEEVVLEISRCDSLLEPPSAHSRRAHLSGSAAHRLRSKEQAGQFELLPQHFAEDGIYEVEVGAIYKDGKVSHFSDPIFVRVGGVSSQRSAVL